MTILEQLINIRKSARKSIAVLIDPDKIDSTQKLDILIGTAKENQIDFFLIGGSLITNNFLPQLVQTIKENTEIPVVLFPGSNMHIDFNADAILFLSLISGRNPELLIGQHVVAAPIIKSSGLEAISCGYMLIHAGNNTSVAYMSNTSPIPSNKYDIAASTAMAGEMLGLKSIYLDSGSGAEIPASAKMISAVRKVIEVPLIVGGGINTAEKAKNALSAGADLIVIGNAIEKDPKLLVEVSNAICNLNEI